MAKRSNQSAGSASRELEANLAYREKMRSAATNRRGASDTLEAYLVASRGHHAGQWWQIAPELEAG
eukprot:11089149-Prorocentrum_lima.AAC.1